MTLISVFSCLCSPSLLVFLSPFYTLFIYIFFFQQVILLFPRFTPSLHLSSLRFLSSPSRFPCVCACLDLVSCCAVSLSCVYVSLDQYSLDNKVIHYCILCYIVLCYVSSLSSTYYLFILVHILSFLTIQNKSRYFCINK